MTLRLPLAVGLLVVLSSCSGAGAAERPESPLVEGAAANRQRVQTAAMRIERENPEGAVEKAVEVATQLGGYAQAATSEDAILRVPAAKLSEAMTALATMGKVAQRVVRTDDVTEARSDLVLRIDNLQRARERYLELLAKATSVAETLVVEREVERATLELERLQSQLQQVDSQVQFAELAVSFERPVRPGPIGWVFYGVFSAVKWLFVWS